MKTLFTAAILAAIMTVTTFGYTDDDLYILSHIISAEAGNCSEDMMLSVGSVVLNRVADDRFPDTLYDVVFQGNPTQYQPTVDGSYWNDPTDAAVEVAKRLLEEGPAIDESVVWQSEEQQGEIYDVIESPWGTKMYFCY